MPETRIDLLRHGQCEGGEIFRGSTDVALTNEGWAAMRSSLAGLEPAPWQRIVSSPLQRCRRFAEALSDQWRLPITLEPDLREMHFGDWEGREYADIWDNDPQLRLWGEDPERHTPPNGEPLADFAVRVLGASERLARTHSDEHLLIVTHGGVIRLLLTQAQGRPRSEMRQMSVPYAHFATLGWREGRLVLAEDNEGREPVGEG